MSLLLGAGGDQGAGETARQAPKNVLLFHLPLPVPAGSLTSLIYGEQSEKTSPSDISLEMEHKDKVGAGVGLGPERARDGGPSSGQTAPACAGRSTPIRRGFASSHTNHS